MPQSVLSSGAIKMESEETKLVGTVGQIFTSKIISQNTILTSGFWGSVAQITLGVDEVIPEEFSISNAYPNPFNPTVNIDFSIPEQTDLHIQVFDLLGRNIFTHQQDFNNPGNYRFQWNARDLNGNNVASGIYIVTIQHKKSIYKQKITFLK
ncbi:MAG: T9SS type A sorting domain-containing protein [Candidatus Neomarinimicrobiota bacterium]